MKYKQVLTTPKRIELLKQWYKLNPQGTLRQFTIYLKHYEEFERVNNG